MKGPALVLALTLGACGLSSAASAQYLQDPTAGMDAVLRNSRERVNAAERAIVGQIMSNPAVQRSYQQYIAWGQGPQVSFEQYAYWHGRTQGFNPQVQQEQMQVERALAADHNLAYSRHMFADAQRRQQVAAYLANSGWNRDEAGRVMLGTSAAWDPQSGNCYAQAYVNSGLPYQGQIPCPPTLASQ